MLKKIKQLFLSFQNLLQNKKQLEEMFFTQIMDNLSEGLYQSTLNGKFLNCNDAFAKIYGYQNKEELLSAIGNITREIYVKASDRTHLIQLLSENSKVVGFETQVYKKNKDIIWIRINVVKAQHPNEGFYYEGSVVDITNEKKAQSELKLEKSRSESILNYSNDVISILDMQGEFIYASKSSERIFGYSESELIGTNIFNYIHPSDRSEMIHIFRDKIVLNRNAYRATYRFLHGNGTYLFIESEGANMLNDPAISGILVNSRDISERVIQEKKILEQNLVLTKTNEDLDKLLYSLSHEVRGPIANLIGLVELHKLENPDVPVDSFMDSVSKTSTKLNGFLRKMADYSFNLRMDVNPTTFHIKSFLEQLISQFKLTNPSKLQFYLEGDSQLTIYTDTKRLSIILENLFENATHFKDFNKSENKIFIEFKETDEGIEIQLKDNGIGIEESIWPKIFERNFRGTKISKGTGMGLFLSNEIASKLNCQISFHSEYGIGTQFVLMFPNEKSKELD